MKPGAAIKSGITVGIGFIGLGLVVGLLNSSLQPAIEYYSKVGSGFTVADIGWPAGRCCCMGGTFRSISDTSWHRT